MSGREGAVGAVGARNGRFIYARVPCEIGEPFIIVDSAGRAESRARDAAQFNG